MRLLLYKNKDAPIDHNQSNTKNSIICLSSQEGASMRLVRVFTIVVVSLFTILLCIFASAVSLMIVMPGTSFKGEVPGLTERQIVIKENLRVNLNKLTVEIGERNSKLYDKLNEAAGFIENEFKKYGYKVITHHYDFKNKKYKNLIATIEGKTDEVIVIGAHYDTVEGCPGADDNGTGVVSILELARLLKDIPLNKTIRFVAFTNEENPFFLSNLMGSQVYARHCRKNKDKIAGMIAVETIGYYSDRDNSQTYPIETHGIFPDKGNFLFFVGNIESRDFLTQSIGAFRKSATLPCQGIAAFGFFEDITRSDNNSFWLVGYPGFMITDTANFRNPNYHLPSDTVESIDFDKLTRAVVGMEAMLKKIAN